MNPPILRREDWLCAVPSALVAMAVYVYAAAPNVTLLDSGEFITAAQHFGVPHPTGYPMWTLLGWVFQLLPLGNAAWEIAIFSGIWGAAATGLFALLASSAGRWIFPALGGVPRWMICTACALLFAFSSSVISQAVIAEVYTLHAFLSGLFLFALYAYIRRPGSDFRLMVAFFFLALAFANHQLSIVYVPLPFLVVLLLRREIFGDLVVFSLVSALLFYLLFAILSSDLLTLRTAIRLFYITAAILLIFLLYRKFRAKWNLLAFLPFVIALGILPYAYLPIASKTNPPMNWGYVSDPAGFFYSLNRSQYSGSLSDQLIDTVGKAMGTSMKSESGRRGDRSRWDEAKEWIGFFWIQFAGSFTPVILIFFFASILVVLREELAKRCWVYLLLCAFFLSAFLLSILNGAGTDVSSWWLHLPFHSATSFFYAMAATIGILWFFSRLTDRHRVLGWTALLLFLLPAWTLRAHLPLYGQRDHWFGWIFGHEMLANLPKGSIVYGGTDPGRFVPTYMIFGESDVPPEFKRDPKFDRRDLYIITQNALADSFYQRYIRDHYSPVRPSSYNAFERWLGRETQYPEETITLPGVDEARAIVSAAIKDAKKEGGASTPGDAHGSVAKWIWEKNKADHAFFVEESFPMEWTYDYAVPAGLIYEIKPEKVALTKEMIDADFAYWTSLIERLTSDPNYWEDYDAQRSFSKLRQTTGNIYRHHKLDAEAERAYLQSLQLWPAHPEAALNASAMMWSRMDFETPVAIFETALRLDPMNRALQDFFGTALRRRELQQRIDAVRETLKSDPKDVQAWIQLVRMETFAAEEKRASEAIAAASKQVGDDPEFLSFEVEHYMALNKPKDALPSARKLVELEPASFRNALLLANAEFVAGDEEAFFKAAEKAVELGGLRVRELLASDARFRQLRQNPRFVQLLRASPSGTQEQKTLRSP